MKIAVTCENGVVFQHFGHTPEFAIFSADGTEIESEQFKSCGDTGHGALAGLLAEENVEVLICGGIGGGAIAALAEAGIQVVGGASGNVRATVEAYLKGTLNVTAGFRCHHHDGEQHDCSSHPDNELCLLSGECQAENRVIEEKRICLQNLWICLRGE